MKGAFIQAGAIKGAYLVVAAIFLKTRICVNSLTL